MPDLTVACHACARVASFESTVTRSAECDGCGADLRVCLNCKFYDESAYNDCGEPTADRVLEKDKANFCDYFVPRAGGNATAGSGGADGSARGELDQLFGKK
jgi:hypothetical protein